MRLPTTTFRVLFPILCACLVLGGCNYARMNDDEAVQTYEKEEPRMPMKSIPATGGIQVLRESDSSSLENPLPTSPETVARGKERYGYYCAMCHGSDAHGVGTVGQSFSPLPADLVSDDVQSQADGDLFYKINLGADRHPPLANTVAAEDAWAVINYLRSLAEPAEGGKG